MCVKVSFLHHYWYTQLSIVRYIILIDAIFHAGDGLERQINELETSVSHLQIQNGKCSIDPSIHPSDSVFDLCIHMCS